MSEMSEKSSHNNYTETEQKFLPLYPEKLDRFRLGAAVIEQCYLSHPSENFTLRLRQTKHGGVTSHIATLKDRGTITKHGLKRLEVSGSISAERFDYYNHDIPSMRKLRAEPYEDVVIDFFENGHIQAESENPESWKQFVRQYGFEHDFTDVTGSNVADNEWIAHEHFQKWRGREADKPAPDLDEENITDEIIVKLRDKGDRLIVPIGGRSGSGKSTLMRKLQTRLHERGLTTSSTSTDDYNVGDILLREMAGGKWINYDSDEVFDLQLCREHIGQLALGQTVPHRHFDFKTGEPAIIGEKPAADVNFVEGVKAHHPLIKEYADLYYTVPASLPRSIGQRILRDINERPRFSPDENLSYYLEYVEPEYRALL